MTSNTANRNDQPDGAARPGTRGRLLDATFYQAWALDATGAWHYLPVDATPDTAAGPAGETWRERVRDGELRCPYPDCGVPFTGVRRGAGRIAFVHPKTATTHNDKQAKETLWRLAAARSVARAARGAAPDATVTTDGFDLAVTPDVLVTAADGTRVAVECRYGAFGADEWRERHEAYEAAGVVDVWLFAHVGPFARKASAGSEELKPPQPLADLIAAGNTVAWLNPFLGLVGTAGAADGATVTVDERDLAGWDLLVASGGAPATVAAPDLPAADHGSDDTDDAATAAASTPDPAVPDVAEPVDAAAPDADSASSSVASVDEDKQVVEAGPAAEAEQPAETEPAAEDSAAAGTGSAPRAVPDAGSDDEATDTASTIGDGQSASQRQGGWLRRIIGRLRRPAA